MTDDEFRNLFSFQASKDEWLERFHEKARLRFFFHPRNQKDFFLHQLTQIQNHEQILQEADDTIENRFCTLGSDLVSLGKTVDWQRDFKSGKEWPLLPTEDLDILDLGNPSDVKVPWELSRFHQAWWLGKAYWLTRNERYAEKFRDLVQDWIDRNPVGRGVNWNIAMEAAIRSCNWMAGYYFFCGSGSCSSGFWLKVLKSLYVHGVFIRNNLEYSRKNGNHYLSNLVGLIFLGILFSDTTAGKEWRRFGIRALEEEMQRQVYPDGVDYEKSTSYHRLVLELFVAATVLCRRNTLRLSPAFFRRLELMFEFVQHYTRPDGSIPLVGDADDGRLFRFSMNDDVNDHRHLLSVGAILFGRTDLKHSAGKFSQDALWYFGGEGFEKHQLLRDEPRRLLSRAFPQGGFYIMRSENMHLFVDAGNIGMEGRGGHGHNDTLSFELWGAGRQFIVDSGTYAYTFDVKARQEFRSTGAHNTLMVDGKEMAEFAGLWAIEEDVTKPVVARWDISDEHDLLEAEHVGYTQLPQPVKHRRRFSFDKRRHTVLITDILTGSGMHQLQSRFHLHPEVAIEQLGDKRFKLISGSVTVTVELSEPAEIINTSYSPSYGVRIPNKALHILFSTQLPAELTTSIVFV